jgi:hypothetical protein
MFTLTNKDLKSDDLPLALLKLEAFPKYGDIKVTYNIARAIALIKQRFIKSQNEFFELLREYAKLDEKGQFIPHDDEPNTYEIKDEKKEEWKEALLKFEEQSFSIERHKLKLSDLEEVGLSPKELTALAPLLEDEPLVT